MKLCVNNHDNRFLLTPKALFLQMLLLILFTIQLTYAQYETDSFKFDGHIRNYEVHLPQNFQANMPLVIGLHGWSESIDWFKTYTVLHQFADTAGFIVVFPEGTDRSWNFGITYCPIRGYLPTTDDVGFISALIDTIYNRYTIDMQRIYCCGFSTGGEMALRLACELGERFAAVASVAGTLYDPAENWQPIKATPVLHIHGTKDLVEPYYGPGTTTLHTSDEQWSIKKTLDYWIERNQCNIKGDTIALPDLVSRDLCTVQKISFTEGSDNTEVIHYKVIKGGHAWPSSPDPYHHPLEGNRNMDISANAEIWEFFKNYKNPLSNMAHGKTLEVFPKYIPPQQGDTLTFIGQISNPENHQVTVHALIQGENSTFKDSLQLFDDGLHNDSIASDNIFGGIKWLAELDEDYFDIILRTTDSDDSITTFYVNEGCLTTIGPLLVDHYEIPRQSQGMFILNLFLINNALLTPAMNVSAILSTPDTNTININGNYKIFGTIDPGQIKNKSFLVYTQNNPDSIKFDVHIFSNDILFWSDKITVNLDPTSVEDVTASIPTEYELYQSYPNPFNPTTTIKYSIPEQSHVTLKVFDVRGRELAILVNGQQPKGNYEIEFNATELTSGVYFYKIQTGDFVDTRKMILLR